MKSFVPISTSRAPSPREKHLVNFPLTGEMFLCLSVRISGTQISFFGQLPSRISFLSLHSQSAESRLPNILSLFGDISQSRVRTNLAPSLRSVTGIRILYFRNIAHVGWVDLPIPRKSSQISSFNRSRKRQSRSITRTSRRSRHFGRIGRCEGFSGGDIFGSRGHCCG